jgi:hypothetical protein
VARAPTIVLEGAYSASPPLRDLIDLAVLVDVHDKTRHLRTAARGDDTVFLAKWHAIWGARARCPNSPANEEAHSAGGLGFRPAATNCAASTSCSRRFCAQRVRYSPG